MIMLVVFDMHELDDIDVYFMVFGDLMMHIIFIYLLLDDICHIEDINVDYINFT